ncbi:YdcF family protein, partial [Corynebacterium casei]
MDMAIVILGASQYDGRASKVLAARLDEAIATAAEHPGKDVQFFTLGANMPGDRFTEAQVARTYLLDRGITESQVHAVPKGNDTVGSLEAVLQKHAVLFDAPSFLITDPLHTVRA